MDYTTAMNLMWDVATGISVGLLAYGAWLCLAHRFGVDDVEESRPQSAPTHSMPHSFS